MSHSKCVAPNRITPKFIMLVTGSTTFYIQHLLIYDFINARKWTVSKEKIIRKGRFLRLSELNVLSLSAVDQSQNFTATTLRMSETFSLCLRFRSLIVFNVLCSQMLDNYFYVSLNRNRDLENRSNLEKFASF